MASTKVEIKEIVATGGAGRIYFAEDFMDIANNEQVRLALSRLTKEGILLRLSQGIYVYPKNDPIVGTVRPGIDEIAQAVATRQQIKILPTGAEALNKLGLSTQVPMRAVYRTDGPSQKIKLDNFVIEFKRVSARKMSYQGKLSSLVISAVEELGKEKITDAIKGKLKLVLKLENRVVLMNDLKRVPHWIATVILPLVNEE
ncbi:DUF6088 family protein [Chitinophaga arvensicola]|uniref:Transcriptional regulator, AbiEi antitoxin, Type IV TA system n=1 Tax=Chitinophaga arvensicola TaxID=29529 RepID=A0A1I0RTB8_9BACT|nr:DUF6088 family protein [Chitinophaga arvensicola]SEW44551.1 hypothetical protein SAMN04488122_3345 [Chitinophaga arvensicola]